MPTDDYFVLDNRNNNSQGPYSRDDAKKLCSNLNDFVERNMTPEEKKAKTNQRDRRPFTFGTEKDFLTSGKLIKKVG